MFNRRTMKKKTLEILKKVSKNELTPDEAQKQLFVLFGVINQVCDHPEDEIWEIDGKLFCNKCQKYVKRGLQACL